MDNCKRYFFVILNILYVVLGLLLLFFALWLKLGSPIKEIATDVQVGRIIFIVTLVVGCLLTLLGAVGICGSLFRKKVLLVSYIIVVGVFLFIEAAAVIYVAFTSITENSKVIDLNVWNAFGVETQDILQERFQCCGFQNVTTELISTDDIRCSCYKNQTKCENGEDLDNYFKQGCYDTVVEWVSNNKYALIAIIATVFFVELLQVVVACLLVKDVNRRNQIEADEIRKEKRASQRRESPRRRHNRARYDDNMRSPRRYRDDGDYRGNQQGSPRRGYSSGPSPYSNAGYDVEP